MIFTPPGCIIIAEINPEIAPNNSATHKGGPLCIIAKAMFITMSMPNSLKAISCCVRMPCARLNKTNVKAPISPYAGGKPPKSGKFEEVKKA